MLPTYGNTHSESSVCADQTKHFREEARCVARNGVGAYSRAALPNHLQPLPASQGVQHPRSPTRLSNCPESGLLLTFSHDRVYGCRELVRAGVGATTKDAVLFCGSGSTAGIHTLVGLLGIPSRAPATSLHVTSECASAAVGALAFHFPLSQNLALVRTRTLCLLHCAWRTPRTVRQAEGVAHTSGASCEVNRLLSPCPPPRPAMTPTLCPDRWRLGCFPALFPVAGELSGTLRTYVCTASAPITTATALPCKAYVVERGA